MKLYYNGYDWVLGESEEDAAAHSCEDTMDPYLPGESDFQLATCSPWVGCEKLSEIPRCVWSHPRHELFIPLLEGYQRKEWRNTDVAEISDDELEEWHWPVNWRVPLNAWEEIGEAFVKEHLVHTVASSQI